MAYIVFARAGVDGGAGRSIEASETWRVVVFLLGFNILSIALELFLQSVSPSTRSACSILRRLRMHTEYCTSLDFCSTRSPLLLRMKLCMPLHALLCLSLYMSLWILLCMPLCILNCTPVVARVAARAVAHAVTHACCTYHCTCCCARRHMCRHACCCCTCRCTCGCTRHRTSLCTRRCTDGCACRRAWSLRLLLHMSSHFVV